MVAALRCRMETQDNDDRFAPMQDDDGRLKPPMSCSLPQVGRPISTAHQDSAPGEPREQRSVNHVNPDIPNPPPGVTSPVTDFPLAARLDALSQLGTYIASEHELLGAYVSRSAHHNGWFTPENQWRMLRAIAEDYLDREKLAAWVAPYTIPDAPSGKTVGLVLAGNLPLVGFHDWLSVMVAGHNAIVKLSDKDPYVLPHLVKKLEEIEPRFAGHTRFAERLKDFDAVIATGSNNSSRYFQQYFGKYPHIIRGNRTSVAILHGDESGLTLKHLADDVFAYFGLGCRSVGKVYVPRGYTFKPLLEALHEHKQLANHSKWKNNFDYNYALLTINKAEFMATGSIIVREDAELHSRLATLHYEYYDDLADLAIELHGLREELQAVVSAKEVPGVETVRPGQGQRPGLGDYADGVDTMAFLSGLN